VVLAAIGKFDAASGVGSCGDWAAPHSAAAACPAGGRERQGRVLGPTHREALSAQPRPVGARPRDSGRQNRRSPAWRYAPPGDPGFTWDRRNGYQRNSVILDSRID